MSQIQNPHSKIQNRGVSIQIANPAECEMIMPRTKILIVDDHAVVREGLKSALGDCSDSYAVGEGASGRVRLSRFCKLISRSWMFPCRI